jgi:RNA polymerase sigma-70 factor (ECF subfamily)
MHEDDAPNSDEALMQRYRDGDAGAFDTLYARHKGGVFRYVLRQCGNRGVAEELFQDIWMNLIRARLGYTVRAKFTTYLYTLAHHRLIDYYRTQRGGVPVSFDDEDGPPLDELQAAAAADPAQQVANVQQAQQLLQLIEALPPPQREAFLLQQEAGMSIEDIAQATGVSRETAKSRLRYALARLRRSAQELP